jgi:hypothetical protein
MQLIDYANTNREVCTVLLDELEEAIQLTDMIIDTTELSKVLKERVEETIRF